MNKKIDFITKALIVFYLELVLYNLALYIFVPDSSISLGVILINIVTLLFLAYAYHRVKKGTL